MTFSLSQVLQRHVQIAQRSSDIILAGDFNARLAGLPDEFETDLQVRGFTDPIVNSHGRRLLEFCKENRLYLSTGRTRGDEEGQASFKARQDTQASRLDHVISARANSFDLLPDSACGPRLPPYLSYTGRSHRGEINGVTSWVFGPRRLTEVTLLDGPLRERFSGVEYDFQRLLRYISGPLSLKNAQCIG